VTARKPKCQVLREWERATSDLVEMPDEAYRHETYGWQLTFETAPRCDDRECETCWGWHAPPSA
jgi:hypothetical protein